MMSDLERFLIILCLLIGSSLVFVKSSLSLRQVGQSAALLLIIVVAGAVCYLARSNDIREPDYFLLNVAYVLAGYFSTGFLIKNYTQQPSIIQASTGSIAVLTLFVCMIALLLGWSQPRNSDRHDVTSPDGRMTATMIFWDSSSGNYFVALKPSSIWYILAPAHQVTEVEEEGLDEIRWVDSHTLLVNYDQNAQFIQQDRQWNGITIIYRKSAD
jgi:hypothetical protein